MNSEEFLLKICELGISWSKKSGKEYSWYWESHYPKKNKTGEYKEVPTLDDSLYLEWCTGGITGGSCWDDGTEDNHRSMSGEKEPEFEALDKLLTGLCPKITFLQYKTLVAGIIKYDERTVYEYYGNCTNYGVKTIKLGDLYKKLKELELI